jgi:subtilisin family serine protease
MARVVSSFLAALAACVLLPATATAEDAVSDEIIVMRQGGLTPAEQARAGVVPERRLPIAGVEVVTAPDDRADALAVLRADKDVAWAEPNRPRHATAERLGGLLWGFQNTGQSVWFQRGSADADIDAPEAWTLSRGAGVTVAVVDTGVDLGHPDLLAHLVAGRDFVEDDDQPQDGYGHGTHVAGTIAAVENGTGVVGVAPDALLMPLRVLDSTGTGNSADVAAAFAFAGARGVRVVNASLGSTSPSQVERTAIRAYPGTLFVVAAGNRGADNDGAAREYPCTYDEPNVLCIGATDSRDARASFSNYGAASVDLFAPGTITVSTYPRGMATMLDRYFATGDGYEIMEGTSMAAPHAAGAAALAAALRPDWGPGQIKAALMDGADRLPSLNGVSLTGARLNAATTAQIAAGVRGNPAGSQGPLGPAVSEGGADTGDVKSSDPATAPAPNPTLSELRITGTPRVCRRTGCQARTAALSFLLAADADVTVRLDRRRCGRTRCTWRRSGKRTRRSAAGRNVWAVGTRLAGMRLARGTWRVTLATAAGASQKTFRVR